MTSKTTPHCMTQDEYQLARDTLVQRVANNGELALLVKEISGILRFEIENGVPEADRLAALHVFQSTSRAKRTALISDIHGNHAGLLAVLDDIKAQKCDRIVCLGDLVEGGTENEQVIETLRHFGVPCVRGNHDENNDVALSEASRKHLANLPERIIENDILYVHNSPRTSKRKIDNTVEAWNVFEEFDFRLIFVGHVHVPHIFGKRSSLYGEAMRHEFEYNKPFELASNNSYIVSVGSVGYGRDQMGKLRYAVFDHEKNSVEQRAIDGAVLPLDCSFPVDADANQKRLKAALK